MKIRGDAKIPDYVQLRNKQMVLIAYFRADRPDEALRKAGLGEHIAQIKQLIADMPYGKLTQWPEP